MCNQRKERESASLIFVFRHCWKNPTEKGDLYRESTGFDHHFILTEALQPAVKCHYCEDHNPTTAITHELDHSMNFSWEIQLKPLTMSSIQILVQSMHRVFSLDHSYSFIDLPLRATCIKLRHNQFKIPVPLIQPLENLSFDHFR